MKFCSVVSEELIALTNCVMDRRTASYKAILSAKNRHIRRVASLEGG
jgi:hypothetical protein